MPDFTPQRVVSLQPSATVILDRLGLLDRVVGCTRYCADVCPEVSNSGRTVVEDSWTAKADQILATRPDLVIASVPYQEKAIAEILKSGARFLGLAPRTLADVYADIAAIAGIMGAPGKGADVIRRMQVEIEGVRAQSVKADGRPRVYCEEWGKPLIHSQAWVAELVHAAGGDFVGCPGRQTTSADVNSASPDVIIASWCGAGDRVPLEKVVRERGWSELPAVRAGRVFCVRDELLNTPAPTLIGGLYALAWAVHPHLFPQPTGIRTMKTV